MARGSLPRWYRDPASQPAQVRTALASRFAQQRERARQLDALRIERGLTHAEQAEADRLADCLYQRVRRQQLRERGIVS